MKKIADRRGTRLAIFLCLLPALAIYTYVVIVPIIGAFRYSLFNWSGGPNMKYIGLKNYQMLLKDKNFWAAFLNNLFRNAVLTVHKVKKIAQGSSLFSVDNLCSSSWFCMVFYFQL